MARIIFNWLMEHFKIIISSVNRLLMYFIRGQNTWSQVSDIHQIPYIIWAERKTRMPRSELCLVMAEIFFFFFFYAGSVWKIDGIALCQPRAVQVPADWLRLLCSKKGNYNVNVSQQESEPEPIQQGGRQKVMERAESLWVNSKTASGERFISNTQAGGEGVHSPMLSVYINDII